MKTNWLQWADPIVTPVATSELNNATGDGLFPSTYKTLVAVDLCGDNNSSKPELFSESLESNFVLSTDTVFNNLVMPPLWFVKSK